MHVRSFGRHQSLSTFTAVMTSTAKVATARMSLQILLVFILITPFHNSAEHASLASQQRDDHLENDLGDSLENLTPHMLHLLFCHHCTM